ncbi:unnamed protein product [Durusdinium trenchii]|uniref:Myb/SANT-like domain-containing protein n=1 Tax=Durusdinium trenchii TaxID=1381693 RepID=A0ABP0JR92_9DINO
MAGSFVSVTPDDGHAVYVEALEALGAYMATQVPMDMKEGSITPACEQPTRALLPGNFKRKKGIKKEVLYENVWWLEMLLMMEEFQKRKPSQSELRIVLRKFDCDLQGLALRGFSGEEWEEKVDLYTYKIQRLWSAGRRRWRDTVESTNMRFKHCKEKFQYWKAPDTNQEPECEDLVAALKDPSTPSTKSEESHGTLSAKTKVLGAFDSDDDESGTVWVDAETAMFNQLVQSCGDGFEDSQPQDEELAEGCEDTLLGPDHDSGASDCGSEIWGQATRALNPPPDAPEGFHAAVEAIQEQPPPPVDVEHKKKGEKKKNKKKRKLQTVESPAKRSKSAAPLPSPDLSEEVLSSFLPEYQDSVKNLPAELLPTSATHGKHSFTKIVDGVGRVEVLLRQQAFKPKSTASMKPVSSSSQISWNNDGVHAAWEEAKSIMCSEGGQADSE